MNKVGSINQFNNSALLALFLTSYAPLFIIIVLKQLFSNSEYLKYNNISQQSILCLLEKFGLTIISVILTAIGIFGLYRLLRNLNKKKNNGYQVKIISVKNENNQFSNYIVSYIIPIAFLSSDKIIDSILILILLLVIYRLYIKSSMILVNPTLSFWGYYLYDIEYMLDSKNHSGTILIKDSFIEKNDKVIIYQIGVNTYFGFNT